MIVGELKRFVEERVSPDAWPTLLDTCGLTHAIYTPLSTHPDEEFEAMLASIGTKLGRTRDELLEDFGAFIAPRLLHLYSSLIPPGWRTLDVVEHAEATIHRVVRMRSAGASPPVLRTKRAGDGVVLEYASSRNMCHFARGIVHGIAHHFGESVFVVETKCMQRGADECELVVRTGRPSSRPP